MHRDGVLPSIWYVSCCVMVDCGTDRLLRYMCADAVMYHRAELVILANTFSAAVLCCCVAVVQWCWGRSVAIGGTLLRVVAVMLRLALTLHQHCEQALHACGVIKQRGHCKHRIWGQRSKKGDHLHAHDGDMTKACSMASTCCEDAGARHVLRATLMQP
jgi:hypothetical protein